MPIHAAQNNIPEGDGALILPLPTPAGVVLEVSLSLFVTYISRILTDIFLHCLFTTLSSLRSMAVLVGRAK